MLSVKIRLPEGLKARVAACAECAGTSSHSFIVEAVAEKVELEERRTEFSAIAENRCARIIASGKTIRWIEMRRYLKDRLAGKAAKRPVARKLVR